MSSCYIITVSDTCSAQLIANNNIHMAYKMEIHPTYLGSLTNYSGTPLHSHRIYDHGIQF